jgi:hypothetical protein
MEVKTVGAVQITHGANGFGHDMKTGMLCVVYEHRTVPSPITAEERKKTLGI